LAQDGQNCCATTVPNCNFGLRPNNGLRIFMQSLRKGCRIWAILAAFAWILHSPRVAAEPLGNRISQEAYLWQRAWNDPVRRAVAAHSDQFKRIVVLNAEVTWLGNQPHLIRVPLDYAALRSARCPMGLALRIGPYRGPFASTGEPVNSLIQLALTLLRDAGTNELRVTELQIDFDCADSKLSGYRAWVEAIRGNVSPTPVTITVLPSWLPQAGFKELVAATDGFVLQVHSLARPQSIDTRFSLCDPVAAQRAVERAGQFGVAFRVALPTYGYLVAFDRDGKFIGLSAEGPSRSWPESVQTREVRADPRELAQLVGHWSTNRPAMLNGVIWYRLPIEADVLNWPWPTLAAAMNGREPRASWRAQATAREAGSVDIELVNDGEGDLPIPAAVIVRWHEGRLVAGDGLQGFELFEEVTPTSVRFEAAQVSGSARLPPGHRCLIGWLRLSKNQEVRIEIPKSELSDPRVP
jgi:Protein of unknown function (DUF3142)